MRSLISILDLSVEEIDQLVNTGLDIIEKIADVKTGRQDKPAEDVIIETIEVTE